MSKLRKVSLYVLACVMVLSCVLMSVSLILTAPTAYALEANETKANTTMKVEFSIPKEAQVGGTLPEGTVINRGISLFNWVGDGNTGLKPGYKLAYDVYSPTPVAGLGFFGGAEEGGEWKSWDYRFTEEKDQNGISAQSHADLTDYFGNGWYSREIEFGKFLTVDNGGLASSHWAMMLETKSPVPYEKLTVFVKNARILDENGEIVCYCFYKGKTDDRYVVSPYNFPTKLNEVPNKDDGYMYWPPEGDPATDIVTEGIEENVRRIKTTVEFADNVNPAQLSFPMPVQGINKDIDFKSVTNLDGATLNAVKVFKLTEAGEIEKEVAVDNFKINVPDMGKYRVELKATKGDLETNAVLYLWTVDPAVPFIFEADTDVIQRVYADKETIKLPKVSAYYKDQLFPMVPDVLFGENKISVTEGESEFTFDPEKYGDYTVTYTYTDPDNTAKTVTSTPVVIRVGEMTVDLTGLVLEEKEDGSVYGAGEIGTAYDLTKAVFNDPEKGKTEYTVKVTKGGVEQPITGTSSKDYSFVTDVPGEYVASFTAVNFMGEEIKKDLTLVISAIEGMITKLQIYVPEALRAEGVRKTAEIRVFGWLPGPAIGARDTINYSIFMPNPVPGVGMIDFLGDGTSVAGWGKFSVTGDGLTGKEVDAEGIAFTSNADLTSKLKDENGKSVWYNRSLAAPACYAGVGGMCDMVLYINTTAAVGEYIDVYFKDVYFAGDDGTNNVYFNGLQTAAAPSVMAAVNPPTPGGYSVAANAQEDGALKVEIGVPETHRGEVEKQLTIRLFGWAEKSGLPGKGTLSYDIKMENAAAGFGFVNFYGNNTSPIGWGTLFGADLVDVDGIAFNRDADISAKAANWYTRKVAYDTGAAAQGICDAFLDIHSTAAVGEKVVIYLNNIKFIAEDGTETVYYGTGATLAPNVSFSSNIDPNNLPKPDNFAVTGGAVYADGPMLYKLNLPKDGIVACAEKYTFSDKLAYDYVKKEFVDYTLKIVGPDRKEVAVDGKSFTPVARGKYRVTITATNENGTLEKKFVVEAVDEVEPVIGDMTLPTDAKVGSEVTITAPEVTDNSSSAEDILVRITLSGPDNKIIKLENGKFTPAVAGEYTIKVIAIDGADNSSNREFKFTVQAAEEKPVDPETPETPDTPEEKGGCGGFVATSEILAAATLLISAAAVVLFKKSTNKR